LTGNAPTKLKHAPEPLRDVELAQEPQSAGADWDAGDVGAGAVEAHGCSQRERDHAVEVSADVICREPHRVLFGAAAAAPTTSSAVSASTGGLGVDSLTGGAGADSFFFDTRVNGSNVDKIRDFAAADDTLALAQSIFTAIEAGTLDASAFQLGTAAHYIAS
jgi:Ca2+-binding RTX toxin-like protein